MVFQENMNRAKEQKTLNRKTTSTRIETVLVYIVVRLIPNELYRDSVQRLKQPNKLFTNKLETVDLYFGYINRIDLVRYRDTKYSLSFIPLSYPNLA